MRITALNGYTLAYLVRAFEKAGILSEREAARFDGVGSPEYLQVPEGRELEAQSLLSTVNQEVYKFQVEGAPVAKVESKINLSALRGKDFIKWLRRQIRQFGRRSVVGYVGDHVDNPVEMWLKDLGFKSVSASSMQYLMINDEDYNLDYQFAGLLMMVCDQGPECNLDAYEFAEIGACAMLQHTLELLDPEACLIAR
jgi:hypothetical protein